jgi:crossover junction endodeoxyribonuclease RuvC
MTILGLDPGIARTGYGVLDTSQADLFVRCGCITTPDDLPGEDRLKLLADDLTKLIAETTPDVGVVEHVYFGANKKTAMLTAEARGVLLYVLRQHRITVESLTPLQIKSRLTGYGAANKDQVQTAVRQQLRLHKIPKPDDAADALAAALCLT